MNSSVTYWFEIKHPIPYKLVQDALAILFRNQKCFSLMPPKIADRLRLRLHHLL